MARIKGKMVFKDMPEPKVVIGRSEFELGYLSGAASKRFEEILMDEELTPVEWLENMISDYES